MTAPTLPDVETRTQELGRALYGRLQAYGPPLSERVQNRLMVLLMEDHTLRNRLLRFVDVLAALSHDRSGRHTASLFREYFRGDFSHLPPATRLALRMARSPLIPSSILAWGARRGTQLFASRFIVPPGKATVDRSLRLLREGGRFPSFDLLGEAILSEEEATRYRQSYLELLEILGRSPDARRRTPSGSAALQVSLKLSSLTSQFNPADPEGTLQRVRPALEEICLAASERGVGVTVDAEQFANRDLTWLIVREVLAPGGPLGGWADGGLVVQAYLSDAETHARDVIAFARRRDAPLNVRLVKGAYWDYEVIVAEQNGWPVPVFRDKALTDLTYERITRLFLQERSPIHLAVASHNIRSHAYAEAVREKEGLPDGAIEHQTLYRTLEALSTALVGMGWPERDYVPVGDLIPGMAYLVRRILENTSQAGFLTRTRLREDVESLLAVPQPGNEDSSHRKPSHPTGFANTPPTRLFDAVERERFQGALIATRARWGSSYPLELGRERTETSTRVPSLSPSYPDPTTPVGWIHLAGLEETEHAISLANAAAPLWAARPAEERARIGLAAAEILRSRKDEVAAWVIHEGAKNWQGALADVEEAIDHLAWSAHQLQRLDRRIQANYVPVGVVACIPPWNFPIAIPAGMICAALMAGNAVILKPAGPTPLITHALVGALHVAGVPKEVLIHLPGSGGTVGARLVESPDVDMIAFTGSKDVGLGIYRAASQVVTRRGGMKHLIAEMGGKNAIVVFPDADLDEAVSGILGSAFGHAGQKCSACSRVLVHRAVLERLRTRLVESARSLPIGPADLPGTFINPIIDSKAKERIASFGAVAREEGTVLLPNGADGWDRGGNLLGPLIVEVATEKASTARLAQEEIFGPVLTLIPFDTEAEAIDLVNNTIYALTLGIFSRSPGTIVRLVRACDAGNIYINREITGARVGIEPFGGYKLSGTGPKVGGEEYLPAFLTRRDSGRRPVPDSRAKSGASGTSTTPVIATATLASSTVKGVSTWAVPPSERLSRLREAGHHLANHDRAALDQALGGTGAVARALEGFFGVLFSATEITEPQPTVAIPGQTTFVNWTSPRGIGLVAVDAAANPGSLPGLVAAGLLAGNGLIVAADTAEHPVVEVLAKTLQEAGIPPHALRLAPPGATVEDLAREPIHFAAVDLDAETSRALFRTLGETSAESGQAWIKILINLAEGPRPGEPGFLRRFSQPKVVAIKTLRHGAELELV